MNDVTRLLQALKDGRAETEDLLPLVYQELRRLAVAKLHQERAGHTLQATALVHEAYLRLVDVKTRQQWDTRAHFFAAAAEAMRRILVESARRKMRLKRGQGFVRHDLDEHAAAPTPSEELLELHEALDRLQQKDPRKAELVKLRYFAGLSMAEVADLLGVSISTADRDWAYARAWLYREMSKGG